MGRVASSGLVDAILVLDVAPDDERVALSRAIDTPTIFIGVPDDHEGLICVDLDFDAAAVLAVDRLADAGHRSIALIGQPQVAYEKSNFPPRVRRAFEARAAERGIRSDFRVSGHHDTSRGATRRAVAELLDGGATALVVHAAEDVHDVVLAELAGRGLSVPGDVSVVSVAASFDTKDLAVALDVIPLIPAASCDLAVELAMQQPHRRSARHRAFISSPRHTSTGTRSRPPGAHRRRLIRHPLPLNALPHPPGRSA